MSHITMEQLRAELLADMHDQMLAVMEDLGIEKAQAEHVSCACVDHLAQHWGGQVVSIPKDHAYRLSQREKEILERYRHGALVRELASVYGMTERGMRKLLARATRRDHCDNQLDLFGTDESGPDKAAA
jgi:Mor family transcriptional regulator